ncbi:PAS and ANTAR domain-containing protein [Nocardioides sp. TF02-7]|uniref:PAS and ANTAR domain-containing protein n=1 Tax=Nocardioides sp. TF02-7 TaxID=2917724 RepID=UPI001F056645|nr:PAS and ANTAR domain-containing protein [Nocardioides sp. TF02-7]UMG93664.1 PAS and ANTAR domain-containing protein [Nocardioides sp. TF02-7]
MGVEEQAGERQTGRFTYDVAAARWTWDDDVYAIHGYEPGEVEPTTDLFLRHKHEHDRQRVEQAFLDAAETGEPFNIYYRIRARGAERRVVVVGEGERDDSGRVTHLVGYYLDLTPEFTAAADEAVAASAAARDTIEQAKGVLMLGYGLDADAAFAMLRWWSRNRNVKVRDIAERLLTVAREGHVSHPGLRRLLDALIDDLTAERRARVPAPQRPVAARAPADHSGANQG